MDYLYFLTSKFQFIYAFLILLIIILYYILRQYFFNKIDLIETFTNLKIIFPPL